MRECLDCDQQCVREEMAMVDNEKKSFFDSIGEAASSLAAQGSKALQDASKAVGDLGQKAGELTKSATDKVVAALDANGSGEVDIEDFIIFALRTPGIGVNRTSYLRAEFRKTFPEEVIEEAVRKTPAKAGITVEQIDKLANQAIAYERNCVTGISTALGMPGGAAMIATVPSDMIQYYGFMLRAAQKLLYLYGFPQIDVDEKNSVFDSETLNMLTLCMGVMFGVSGANQALRVVANALAKGVEKKLLQKALTKGTIYPMVKSIAKWFGQNMTKKVFAGFFKKAIPVLGGLIGGGITYLSFGPCCEKLRDTLHDTILSNPNASVDESEVDALINEDVEEEKDAPEDE